MKKNVLVFPCGSEIGLELHRALSYSTHFNLVGAASVDDHGEYVFESYVSGLPFVSDESFIDKVNQVVKDYKIDYIFPAHDSVVLKLAQTEAAGQLACPVVTSPAETCEVARSKGETYRRLEGQVAIPKIFASLEDVAADDYPVFLKPDVGQGSKGTYKVKDAAEAKFYIEHDPSLLILEYLPGREYTIDCFTDRNGELRFCEGRERARINNGISVSSQRVTNERFRALAETINKELKFRGVWFFQVKEREDGELVMMEIAPRVAGTMGLSRCMGANLALLSLFDLMDYDLDIIENNIELVIDRALENRYRHNIDYKHVYLDFDDLVILDGKVNPHVMAYVYQCFNKGVQVHLLTKHADELPVTLKKFKLDGVFDDITWIKPDEHKHQHITHKDAIFIDDSHAERLAVHRECGIPVFDAHSLEALMEKF